MLNNQRQISDSNRISTRWAELISFADIARLHFVISTHAETVALTFQLFFVFHESLMIVAYCEDWRGRQR